MSLPLVSIVTPTLPGREALLIRRCMVSIMSQDYEGEIEHVVVSDANPKLRNAFDGTHLVRLVEIGDNWRNATTERSTGGVAWMIGSYLALGDFVGFCGDDDELLPHHVSAHVEAMQREQATWSLSKVEFRAHGEPTGMVVGDTSYALGHLDATGIMCFKGALGVARWNPNGENATDWQMVNGWRNAGLVGAFVDDVTGIHHDGWLIGKSGVA